MVSEGCTEPLISSASLGSLIHTATSIHVHCDTEFPLSSCAGDVDYNGTSSLLIFNATTLSINISVPILDDDIFETDEVFFGELEDLGEPVIFNPGLANVTILDCKL